MKPFHAVFQIVEDNNCPLYELEDVFVLKEVSASFPEGKESCLILIRELTELLFQLLGDTGSFDFTTRYTCSGCTGLIKFCQIPQDDVELASVMESLLTEKEQKLFNRIRHYPLLKAIPMSHLKNVMNCFKGKVIDKNDVLIVKGKPSEYLYILLSGEVRVEDGQVPIARLSEGEICGEMSYLGDNIASTSVRALEKTTVLAMSGKDFCALIKKSSSVQMHMARLLAERLSRANAVRAKDFDACMQGRLSGMVPAELLQIFHMHQKTGVLKLELPKGTGKVSFLEGAIVVAEYVGKSDRDAVFAILEERQGVYSFTTGLPAQEMKRPAIGDFMMLLIEGVKRVDED